MSTRTTANPLKVTPSVTTGGLSITAATSAWGAAGAWVEVFANTAAPTTIAGLTLTAGTLAGVAWELEFGVGGAGSEVVVAVHRDVSSSANRPLSLTFLAVPFSVAAGVRLAARQRSASAQAIGVAFSYYETFDSPHVVNTATLILTDAPLNVAGATLTPSGSAWASSAWVELFAGVAREISLLGVVVPSKVATTTREYDLGIGGSGAEVAISTLRTAVNSQDFGAFQHLYLPAAYPIPPSTRVAVRMRKTGTSATTSLVALLYVDQTAILGTLLMRRPRSQHGTRTGARQIPFGS